MDKNTVILITGILVPEHVDNLIITYNNIENKIISTWENSDSESIDKLLKNNFKIIFSKLEEQEYSNIPQLIPIVNGIQYAKSLGYTYLLRSRTDIFSHDFLKYLEKTKHLYRNKITAISGIETNIIYFLDIIVCGSIEKLEKFYKLQEKNDTTVLEVFLLENICGKKNLTRNDIKNNVEFTLDICRNNNIEFIWVRPPIWKKPFRSIPHMRVINEYCIDYFIWN